MSAALERARASAPFTEEQERRMREIVREETARQSAIIAAIRRAVLQLASVFADERKI